MIPIQISVRGIIIVSLIILGLAIFVIVNNSKEKEITTNQQELLNISTSRFKIFQIEISEPTGI